MCNVNIPTKLYWAQLETHFLTQLFKHFVAAGEWIQITMKKKFFW